MTGEHCKAMTSTRIQSDREAFAQVSSLVQVVRKRSKRRLCVAYQSSAYTLWAASAQKYRLPFRVFGNVSHE